MGKHRGHQGGRPALNDRVMTERLWIRAPVELAEQIDLRRKARPVALERTAMIRHLLELGIKADIQLFKETE